MIRFFLILLFILGAAYSCKKSGSRTVDDVTIQAKILESPDRTEWQMPERVIDALHLKKKSHVAEIGAGTGYFSRRFADVVTDGIVYAYDADPLMVDFMTRDAANRNLKNYFPKLIHSRNPELPKSLFDIIFFCNTYQFLQHRTAYFRTIAKSLKKDGRIIVIDFKRLEKMDEESGEEPSGLVGREIVKKEFKEAGYKFSRELNFLPAQYFLEFKLN